ncbi:MAG: phosphonate metabolism transcriptional regulator PhnF [Pseudomonadota bacterium]
MHDTETALRGKTPIWLSIANAIRSDIADGRYAPGDRLPTEAALATRFGVNRHTVRHALSKLINENIVRTRRGSGAFVTAKPTDYPIGRRVRFHENLRAAGRQPEKRVLHIEQRGATCGEAAALKVEAGSLLCTYHGLSLADGQPIAVFESLFPLCRLAGIDRIFAQTPSVTEALQRCGVSDFSRVSTRLTATRATATQALHLHVQEGDPLLKSTGLNADAEGTPVEFGRTFFVGDRVTLTLND